MSKIKGQNFRFLKNGAIPEETNVNISITGNTEDTSTKDVTGLYSQQTVTTVTWSATVDTYQAEPADLIPLVTTFNAAQAITVGWDETSGALNRVAEGASFARSGDALLNDLTFTFNDRQPCSVSMQFQGTGNLS